VNWIKTFTPITELFFFKNKQTKKKNHQGKNLPKEVVVTYPYLASVLSAEPAAHPCSSSPFPELPLPFYLPAEQHVQLVPNLVQRKQSELT